MTLPSDLRYSEPTTASVCDYSTLVVEALTPDLLEKRFRGGGPLSGHCYAGSEALYHLLGGKSAGWTPQFIRHENLPHWYLKHESGQIVDVTAEQFTAPVPYAQGKGKGFLTKSPSRRAQTIIERVEKIQ